MKAAFRKDNSHMIDKAKFTALVLNAEQTLYCIAKSMLHDEYAAALCIAGTAFAGEIRNYFDLLFSGADESLIEEYVVGTDEENEIIAENENFKIKLEALVFDEETRVGNICFVLENKKKDGEKLFEQMSKEKIYPEYHNAAWANLCEIFAGDEGQLSFLLSNGNGGWCADKYYLDTARSDENTYYIQGTFIEAGADEENERMPFNSATDILHLSMNRIEEEANGLQLELPKPQKMPSKKSAAGDQTVILSQIGLRYQVDGKEMLVDEIKDVSIQFNDGTAFILCDDTQYIDNSLYTLGTWSEKAEINSCDTVIYSLARLMDLEKVSAVVINGIELKIQ